MELGRFEEASRDFERVIEEVPNHALALDAAAHCYLMMGDGTTGRRYMKRAHALGQHGTFMRVRKGYYDAVKRRDETGD